MKFSLFLVAAFICGVLSAQSSLEMAPRSKVSWFYQNGQIGVQKSTNLRKAISFYPSYSIDGLQVISIHQPESALDYVYYVDPTGKVQYQSSSNTGIRNAGIGQSTTYDSFNPYGVTNPAQGLVTGLINTVIQSKTSGRIIIR